MRVLAKGWIRVAVAVTYLLMVAVNCAANLLPLNGVRTGDVGKAYPNLIGPAAVTFSIWGLIYLLLAIHVLYQLGLFYASGEDPGRAAMLNRVGVFFALSSLATPRGCSHGITT